MLVKKRKGIEKMPANCQCPQSCNGVFSSLTVTNGLRVLRGPNTLQGTTDTETLHVSKNLIVDGSLLPFRYVNAVVSNPSQNVVANEMSVQLAFDAWTDDTFSSTTFDGITFTVPRVGFYSISATLRFAASNNFVGVRRVSISQNSNNISTNDVTNTVLLIDTTVSTFILQFCQRVDNRLQQADLFFRSATSIAIDLFFHRPISVVLFRFPFRNDSVVKAFKTRWLYAETRRL